MIGIDTNVIVRYVVQDDPVQSNLAADLIEESCSARDPGYIPQIVLCELAWVLRGAYGYSRKQVGDVLRQLMVTESFEIEDHSLAWDALGAYFDGKADYADCLLCGRNRQRGCLTTFTLDQKASVLEGFSLLQ